MRKTILCISAILFAVTEIAAENKDTVRVSDFGARPYSFTNCVTQVKAAIEECRTKQAKVLAFESGRYDFWPENATRKEYFISNTSSEEECPSKVKTIGILLESLNGLDIIGDDTDLIFHGKMTMLAIEKCKNIRLSGLHFDFERPCGSELTYVDSTDSTGVMVKVHPDTRFEIANGQMHLFGEGWRSNINHCIEYDPDTQHFFYSQGWKALESSPAKRIASDKVKFNTPKSFAPKKGNTLTIRDIIRDQVGMFILESYGITMDSLFIHYMHGLGIVSQYTKDITMKAVTCAPREDSGRILASSADFMHFSGCSGKVSIIGCRFAGAQDDPINVHGTNLRAISMEDEKTLVLRFMHPQSYGYNAFFTGDTVAFIKSATMERFASAIVTSVDKLNDREIRVTFNQKIPESIELNHDCVENMTCTPEVEIRECYFTRTSTRGTLITTPRRVVISNNIYLKTGMSAILIEGDAEGWYESGPVKDVLITNNTFIDCTYTYGPGNAVIAINPSNTIIDENRPVHNNIRIIGNKFITHGNPVLFAKSTAGLVFEHNTVEFMDSYTKCKDYFILQGCKNASIKENKFLTNNLSKE